MIKSKKDLKEYLEMDAFALSEGKYKRPRLFCDEIWRYQICLRKLEYYLNTKKNIFDNLLYLFYKIKHYKMGVKLGFEIYPNCFGPGLRINHKGDIKVWKDAKVGAWCDICNGVNIGLWKDGTPNIGDRVWIGPGAKIFGNIDIPDDTFIGANAVVCKTFTPTQANLVIAGIPAKQLNSSPPDFIIKRELNYKRKNCERTY